jgi:uncharacterized membrane protein
MVERLNAKRLVTLATGILGVSSCIGTSALAASFQGLGDLPGGEFYSIARDISADGKAVVGVSKSAGSSEFEEFNFEAFRWTKATGMIGLDSISPELGETGTDAYTTNADGSIVAGDVLGLEDADSVFLWTETDGFLNDTVFEAYLRDLSADGSTAVGTQFFANFSEFEAFRWTQEDGFVALDSQPFPITQNDSALGVNADGTVIVGFFEAENCCEAFRWTKVEGFMGLGDLPGGDFLSQAVDTNADGSLIVGFSDSANGDDEVFRWTEDDGMVGLGVFLSNERIGLPPTEDIDPPLSVNADGSVIVGARLSYEDGSEAFRWTEEEGDRSIKNILTDDFGLDLTSWTLLDARGISADGLTIVGRGINPDGNTEGWIATFHKDRPSKSVPEPASMLGLCVIGAVVAGRALKRKTA